MVQRKEILVEYLPIDEQISYVLIEPLSTSKFEYFCDKIWSGMPLSLRGSIYDCSFERHSSVMMLIDGMN
jgi:aromatic ring-cleaving dioxygenase